MPAPLDTWPSIIKSFSYIQVILLHHKNIVMLNQKKLTITETALDSV